MMSICKRQDDVYVSYNVNAQKESFWRFKGNPFIQIDEGMKRSLSSNSKILRLIAIARTIQLSPQP